MFTTQLSLDEGIGYYPGQDLPYGEWVKIPELTPWENNPMCRQERDHPFRELVELIARHGQTSPAGAILTPDGKRVLWDGNRRYRAVQELGWKVLWVVTRTKGNPALLAAVGNSGVRPFTTKEIAQIAGDHPIIVDAVIPTKGRKVRELMEVLGPEYRTFSRRYGTRAYDIARRVAKYSDMGPDGVRGTLLYMITQPDGCVNLLFRAMRDGIEPDRLADIVKSGETLAPKW